MSSALLPLLVVGGVTYELVAAPGGNPIPTPGSGFTPASFPGSTIPGVMGIAAKMRTRYGTQSFGQVKLTSYPSDQNIDPELQKKFDAIESAASKAYNDADEVAKAKAADALNKDLKLDPPLTGHEDWETVAAVVGGATGGAIGGAIGGPIGAKLGALCGAYLGTKLEDLIAKNWDELESWVKGKWGDVKDAVSDAYNEVSDDVSGLWPF